jgi:hypothetical protein
MKSIPLLSLGASCALGTLFLAATPPPAAAAPKREIVLANEALVGSGEFLQENADRFARRLEAVAGWPKNSTKVTAFTRPREALEYIRKNKVAFAVLPIHQFAQARDELKLVPLARAVGPEGRTHSYWAVTRGKLKGPSLEESPGTMTLAMTETYDPQWIRVLFEAEFDTARKFKLLEVPSGDAAVQAVREGKADVAYLAEADWQKIKDQVGEGRELTWVYTSGIFPAPPFVAIGKHANKAEVKKLSAAIGNTCKPPEGTEPCNRVGLMYLETGNMDRYEPIVDKYKNY